MANVFEFEYNGRTWRLIYKTTSDGNCFFHAVFGKLDSEKVYYFDNQTVFRRKCWANFLWYFDKRTMPTSLAEILQRCLSANPKYEGKSVESKECVRDYLEDIAQEDYRVSFEELVVLATLENVKIVVFKDAKMKPFIIEPDEEILGNFPLRSKNKLREVVLGVFEDNFWRLDSNLNIQTEKFTAGSQTQSSQRINLTKSPPSPPPQRGDSFLKSPVVGIHGRLYEIRLVTIFLLNAVYRDIDFRLSTNNEKAGHFDDLILEILPSNEAILLQARYKVKNDKKKLNLSTYYEQYLKINQNFNIKNLILCTNACLEDKNIVSYKKELDEDSLLYYKDANSFCYNLTNYKKKFIRKLLDSKSKEELLKEENITDFLERFRYVSEYPSGCTLDEVVEKLPCQLNMCQPLETRNLSKFIESKVMEWCDNPLGVYLTGDKFKAFLCEYRNDNFCKRIQNFQVFFKQSRLSLDKSKRILRIVPQRNDLFTVIKIYQTLQQEGVSTLFVNLHDGIKEFTEMLSTFEAGQFNYLVIVCFEDVKDIGIRDLYEKLVDILENDEDKKLVVIANSMHSFGYFKRNMALYKMKYDHTYFNDLTDSSQEGVLEKVVRFFRTTL